MRINDTLGWGKERVECLTPDAVSLACAPVGERNCLKNAIFYPAPYCRVIHP